MTFAKIVYMFNEVEELQREKNLTEWDAVRALLGGKGANLAEMTRIGIPVPPGFTISTDACKVYQDFDRSLPSGVWEQIEAALNNLEKATGRVFGDTRDPLLVSCRSGAKFSMPGMMDTVLNIGLNDTTTKRLAEIHGDSRFAYDSYRRLIQMFGSVVMGIADEAFDSVIAEKKKIRNVQNDSELSADDWMEVIARFKSIIETEADREFPQDPLVQLRLAVCAVLESWFGKRAYDYRNATGISHDLGTAVNIQTIVFGNADNRSGTGVVFTRSPVTGENKMYGDFLWLAQGEDVVAGIRKPMQISQFKEDAPKIYAQLDSIGQKLENHFRDMQDIEFTVEKGKLWILQTRDGKRTARAAVKIAVDLFREEMIDKKKALTRVHPAQIDALLHRQFKSSAKAVAIERGRRLIPKAVNASPGAAVGMAVFDANMAEKWANQGEDVILVRPETKPEDVHGMIAAKGILTGRGGATSHAAVVARQFGVPAVCGADQMKIDMSQRSFTVESEAGTIKVREGDWMSIDGGTGEVFVGQLDTETPDFKREVALNELLSWADEVRDIQVWANADYGKDALRARSYGAEGIGLCRTEHMFFEPERVPIVQEMIMAESEGHRALALEQLLPMQQKDFEEIFQAMNGFPVVIRLLDPPLHEFLPSHDGLVTELANLKMELIHCKTLNEIDEVLHKVWQKQKVLKRVEALREANPMLGLRGDRLGIMMPEVSEMQVQAILQAAAEAERLGYAVKAKIMIPLAGHVNELKVMRELVNRVAREVFDDLQTEVKYDFGTMVEVPRAALTADEMAQEASFFSFGTNDLTQTTFGMSRDDAEAKFLNRYMTMGVLTSNPFQTIDEKGVGKLIKMAVELGRETRPDLEVGVCGEHGGDPRSIAFCQRVGLSYVSCSPFRVPGARLAAAHAALEGK